jgi:hypothetical protein
VFKILKRFLLVVLLILIIAGIAKDQIFDTPQKSKKRITLFLTESAKNDLEANIFDTNKTLVYKMYYWSLIPMGELKFTTQVNDLGNVFSFEASTKNSFAEKFILAKADVESYFSKNIHLPYKYKEITDVRGKIKSKEILFDQANLITSRGDRKFKIPMNTYDPISAFVYLLSLPLTEEHELKFVSGEDVYILKSNPKETKDGICKILIEMARENKTSSHGAKFYVWVSADNARVPLVFKCWSPAGYASVMLKGIEITNTKGK